MALVSFETSQAGQGNGNGLGSKTDIVKIAKTNITEAELKTVLEDMGKDGFAVAGVGTADGSAFVGGTTDVVFVALQGAGADYTAEGTNAHGVTGAVTTVESIFKD
jgi:hypothetical protein